jgi:hypothetical protein
MHLVGRSRAFALQLDSAEREIDSLHDGPASELVAALRHTLREPVGPGTLRHVERFASGLLRSLTAGPA